jgi:hypothetical protein
MSTNSKIESRIPKEIRNSNSESTVAPFIRFSDFGLHSDFEVRISDFNHAN